MNIIKNVYLLLIVAYTASCNMMPATEFDQLNVEYIKSRQRNTAQQMTIDSLLQEIDFLKNGAPRLFAEIKQLSEEGKWSNVISVFDKLRKNFPGKLEVNNAKYYYETALEENAWDNANKKNTKSAYEEYIEANDKGKYLTEAKQNISRIKKEQFAISLDNAKKSNTANVWQSFLDEYPDYANRASIEQKIIQLEVDEIFRDKNTGRLPQSEQLGGSGMSQSSVSVKNDTQYELILRYSGPNVAKIAIPPFARKTFSLSSGNYKIAASAGGLNYAGTERLSGDYSSTYYITTR